MAKCSDGFLGFSYGAWFGLHRSRAGEEIGDSDFQSITDAFDAASREAMKKHAPVAALANRQARRAVRVRRASCGESGAARPRMEAIRDFLNPHRRSSLAGTVLRSMNCAIASAGMRTALPQLTRGSFRLASHARIVAGLTASISLASMMESNFVTRFTPGRDCALPRTRKSVVNRWRCGGIPVVIRQRRSLQATFPGQAQ